MFDVSWGDPSSETVAQHRQRKGHGDPKPARSTRRTSLKSTSRSTTSSESSGTQQQRSDGVDNPFKTGKKPSSSKRTTPPPLVLSRVHSGRGLSIFSAGSGGEAVEAQGQSDDFLGHHSSEGRWVDAGQSSPSSTESGFSGWPGPSSAATESTCDSTTDGSTKYEIQQLSPLSFVTRSTEVTITPHDHSIYHPSREVHISADPPSELRLDTDKDSIPQLLTLYSAGLSKSSSRGKLRTKESVVANDHTTKWKPVATETWKPPENWDCSTEEGPQASATVTLASRARQTLTGNKNVIKPSEASLKHRRKHMREMASASPKIMLERLNEKWTEVRDATIYKELEFEKQLWLLTALKYLTDDEDDEDDEHEQDSTTKSPSRISKVLSLYESKASATYLAALTPSPKTETHHLSTLPLCPTLLPTIRPLTVPTPHVQVPYAPSLFSAISALTLPTILPSSSLPSLIKECHRLLLPSGTLHLTILDPCPLSATLGPRMRAWLDQHLMISLETQFRCTTPGRLMPAWLRDAGFACREEDGGKVVRLRFWAAGKRDEEDEGDDEDDEDDDEEEEDDDDLDMFTEVVGRLIWKEIWGGFVLGEHWWWEDTELLEECKRLGTRWECAVVRAMKKT